MNARYYVPYINRFLSADSIVPNPSNPQAFNRYSYVYNNPLRFVDPSGHIGICFYGGNQEQPDEVITNVEDFCEGQLAEEFPEHDWFTFFNSNESIEEALEKIHEYLELNPDEEIIIMGYSWGGAAALKTAKKLSEGFLHNVSGGRFGRAEIEVDYLILLDPVKFFKLRTPNSIPSNVKRTLNYYTNILVNPEGNRFMRWAGNRIMNGRSNPYRGNVFNVDVSTQYWENGGQSNPHHNEILNNQTKLDIVSFLSNEPIIQGIDNPYVNQE